MELNGMFNSEVEEQLHLNFDSNKKIFTTATKIAIFSYVR